VKNLPALKFLLVLLLVLTVIEAYSQVNQWTWMKGDNTYEEKGIYGIKGVESILNKPGARELGISWTDSLGNYWMYGGRGITRNGTGKLSDMWKYNPVNNTWTWMYGDSTLNSSPIYGVKGVFFISKYPRSTNRKYFN
jgi:hypothetical protein